MPTYRLYIIREQNFIGLWRIHKDKMRIIYGGPRTDEKVWGARYVDKLSLLSVLDFNKRFKGEGYAREFKARNNKEAIEEVLVDIL